ncbi:hypothetical protein [Luteitalea sp.]|uniref:hypothetical protein n=1 Tax=Luteitalea sp. TaxID=2004800 RepID=UPI0025B9C86F|nr:hypothetical protein [Luteitalea sp.]
MTTIRKGGLALAGVWAVLQGPPLAAQGSTIGTFRWQLQPFCNVVTVTVVQQGGQYHVDGTDDLCGAARLASVVGRAFPNPDGTIGFGLTTVTTTGAAPVHLDARIGLQTLSGPWTDSAGNAGTFVLTAGAGAGGSPRPIPAGGIAPGSITGAQIAPGTLTGIHLAPGAINAAAAAFGTCPAGAYLRGILPSGSPVCEPIATPPLTSLTDPQGGSYTALAIGTDGLPVIAHFGDVDGTLLVTHCDNRACTSATTVAADDPVTLVGQYASIAIGSDGLPVVSHREVSTGALRVTHCHDVACTTATSTTVDNPANEVGYYTSVGIGGDGLPVISHADVTAGTLRVTHCLDVACTAATTTVADDPANLVGDQTSLAIGPGGLPIIAHRDYTASALRITRCQNALCTTAVSTTVDDPPQPVGQHLSIAITPAGVPVVSHWNGGTSALRVTYCGNAACTGASSQDLPGTTNAVGQYTSMAIGSDGLPVVAHYDQTLRALRVTHCLTVACTSSETAVADDLPPAGGGGIDPSVGGYASLAIGRDGLPIVSHQNSPPRGLRVTRCASRTCQ